MTKWSERFTGLRLGDKPKPDNMRKLRLVKNALEDGPEALEELAELFRKERPATNPDDWEQASFLQKSPQQLDEEFLNEWLAEQD